MRVRSITPFALSSFILVIAWSAPAGETTRLELGKNIPVSYTAEAGAGVSFEANKGDYARIEVVQKTGDARVEVRTADGTVLMGVARNAPPEAEIVEIVVPLRSIVEVEISVARGNEAGGEAWVSLTDLRPATEEETWRVGAEMALDDGDRLTSSGSAEALRDAAGRYATARALFAKTGNRKMEGVALDSLAWVHDLIGEKWRALDLYNEALVIREEVGDKDGEIFTLLGIGLIYNYLGEIDKALETNEHALDLARETGNRRHEANLLHNIGGLLWATDEMQKALEYYRQSLEIRKTLDDPSGMSGTLNNIGDVYRRLGDYDRAMEYFANALEVRTSIGNKRGMAHSLHTMGLVHSARGEWEEARKTFQRALDLRRETGDKRGVAFSLGGLSGAGYALGRVDEAINLNREALALWQEMGERRSLGESQWKLALMLIDLGRLDDAKPSLDKALEIARDVRDRSSEASTLYGLARYERARGNLEASKGHIEGSIAIVESLRGKIASEDLRASYLASVSTFYDFYVSLQMELDRKRPDSGFAARALETSERARARSLIDALSAASVETLIDAGSDLSSREQQLHRQIQQLDRQVVKLAAEGSQATELALAQTKLDKTLADYRSVLDEIRATNPRLSDLMRPDTLSLEEIQALLDPETALVELALGQDESFVWVVTTDGLASATLPARAEIDARSRELYASLAARNLFPEGETPGRRRERIAAADAEWTSLAARLSGTLLGSVRESIAGRRLVVVADGALQYLPFAALPDPSSEDGEPLLVSREVVVLPSASLLPLLRSGAEPGRTGATRVSVVADPVFRTDDARVERRTPEDNGEPGEDNPNRLLLRSAAEVGLTGFPRLRFSRREAEAITSLLEPGEAIQAIDFDASLDAIDWGTLGASQVLHFATHGILNSRSPELSGLVFSLVDETGRPRPGFLTLRDIYALDLDAGLVVLSACQTALGREIRGEGLIGLTRGFMYAGASRVVSSLWRVDDRATAELMKRLYRNLLEKGESPSSALRSAQLELRAERRWSEPYYWAAFTIQGDWR
jgi:CHAT domain-containing protein/tetratricopeptide (TPR) repeat protein